MDISIRGLQNDMIKPSYNCGFYSVVKSVTNIFLISDTTLSLFTLYITTSSQNDYHITSYLLM